MALTKEQKAAKQLDKQIEQAWYQQASGIEVNIMDIPRIFKDVRDAVVNGESLEKAVNDAKEKYRQN